MIVYTDDLEKALVAYTKGHYVEVNNSYEIWEHVESYTLYQLKHFAEFRIDDYT